MQKSKRQKKKNQRIKLPFNSWLLTFLLALQSTNIHTPKHLYVCMHAWGWSCTIQTTFPPTRELSSWLCWGLLAAHGNTCVALRLNLQKLRLAHTVTWAYVCTCTYWDFIHKYTQQVHAHILITKTKQMHVKFFQTRTHVASTASTIHQAMEWMGNILLVHLRISKCVFVQKCRGGKCTVGMLSYVKMVVFNTYVIKVPWSSAFR